MRFRALIPDVTNRPLIAVVLVRLMVLTFIWAFNGSAIGVFACDHAQTETQVHVGQHRVDFRGRRDLRNNAELEVLVSVTLNFHH